MFLIVLITRAGWPEAQSTILVLRWITFFMPLGNQFGILPPLIPCLVYLIGQFNFFFLGANEAGSIIKTLLRFSV